MLLATPASTIPCLFLVSTHRIECMSFASNGSIIRSNLLDWWDVTFAGQNGAEFNRQSNLLTGPKFPEVIIPV